MVARHLAKLICCCIGWVLLASGWASAAIPPDSAQFALYFRQLAQADALIDDGEREAARQLLQKVIQQYPDMPQGYNTLAQLAVEAEDWQGGIALLEQALDADSGYHAVHQNLVLIYRYLAALAYSEALAEQKLAPPSKPELVRIPRPDVAPLDKTALLDGVRGAIEQWAEAWSGADADRYLDSYAASYHPEGVSRANWERTRRDTLARADDARIVLINPSFELISNRHALALFKQRYIASSERYTAQKMLLLERTDNGWQITREESFS